MKRIIRKFKQKRRSPLLSFFHVRANTYPESVVSDGRVVGYDNEMVIRYLDRVIVNDQDYEVRFKGGITVTV